VFLIFTKSVHFICNSSKLWLIISATIVTFATFVGSITVRADKFDRFSFRSDFARAKAPPTPTQSILPQISGGVYLYGETDRSNVIGKEYIIVEIIGNKAIGAFYLPRSEFNCFYGRLKGSLLNLTLIDALDGQKYSYKLRLNANGLTASQQPLTGLPTYRPLSKIGEIDRQILTACKLQLQNKHYIKG
jgi:hypothetical protein